MSSKFPDFDITGKRMFLDKVRPSAWLHWLWSVAQHAWNVMLAINICTTKTDNMTDLTGPRARMHQLHSTLHELVLCCMDACADGGGLGALPALHQAARWVWRGGPQALWGLHAGGTPGMAIAE